MYDSWLFPVVEAAHLVGMALLVGCIALADWRVWRREPALNSPWLMRGLGIQLVTGPLMFASNVGRYSSNPAFQWKILLVAAALVFHFGIRRRWRTRLAAACSLALWTSVVLAARAIADFDL
jgi:hypothetical protein